MEKEFKKIVVMGGSFNPPTYAHYLLMKKAIDALDADIVFFVPVSDAYLRRKMRHSHPPVILSPEMRVKMLETMCTDSHMKIYDKEIGTIAANTILTLNEIKEEYPDYDLYFVMGADKLDLLIHLTEKSQFLDNYNVILYSRGDDNITQTLRNSEILSCYMDHIVNLSQPEGTDQISSSVVREYMLSGKSCKDILLPGVWELFKEFTPSDFPDVIYKFKDEYAFLGNDFKWRFEWEGLEYDNAEAAFQSSKCKDLSERKVYARLSAKKAIIRGNTQIPFAGWENERINIMRSIIKAKFEQNPYLMQKLKDTGDNILINGNNKKESYWGIDLYSWIGENNLGKIIMDIRDKEK